MSPEPTLRAGSALKVGLRLTRSSADLWALLFAAVAVQAVLGASFGPAVMASLEGSASLALGALGTATAAWLCAQLAAAVVFAMAVTRARTRLLRLESGPFVRLALGFFFVGGAIAVAVQLWSWTALGATGWAYGRALLTRDLGLVSAGSFALATVIALPLGAIATLWTRTTLARSGVTGTSFTLTLSEVGASLLRRPSAYALVLIVTSLVAGFGSVVLSGVVFPFTPEFTAPDAQLANWSIAVVGSVLGALATSAGQLWCVHALCALQADEVGTLAEEYLPSTPLGTGPRPVAPSPTSTEPILSATLVETPSAEPVLDATPVKPDETR